MLVQLLAPHTGLHGYVHIFGAHTHDFIHFAEIDTHATVKGCHVAFQGRADPEGNNRRSVLGADPHDLGDFLGAFGERDRVRRVRGVIGLIPPVLLASG